MKENLLIGDVPVELTWRRMKHLTARPMPDGTLRASAPFGAPRQHIMDFLAESIVKFVREGVLPPPHHWVDGEIIHVWGQPCVLRVVPGKDTAVRRVGDELVMRAPGYADEAQRLAALNRYLKRELQAALERRMPLMEARTGLKCAGLSLRSMTSRWGSCRPSTGEMTFNIQLAHKPPECLDEVILHELTHLLYADHSAAFYRTLDSFCPGRRRCEQLLKDPSTAI